MSDLGVQFLASALNEELSVVTEKLGTDEGKAEIEAKMKTFKIHTDDSLTELKSNYKTTLKDELYGENKGTVLETLEKRLKKEHGVEWKHGEDYTDVSTLVSKLIQDKSSDAEMRTTIEALRGKMSELQDSTDKELASGQTEIYSQWGKSLVDSNISGLSAQLDLSDETKEGQLKLFKTYFNGGFELVFKDGQQMVLNKETGKIIKDDLERPVSLNSVMLKEAKTMFTFKDEVKKSGRGGESSNNTAPNTGEYGKYETFDELWTVIGKGNPPTTIEAQQAYMKWKKERN